MNQTVAPSSLIDARRTRFPWDDSHIERLSKLWADGLSATLIAREFGQNVTRNMVLGKAWRLGISGNRVRSHSRAISAGRATRTPKTRLHGTRVKAVSALRAALAAEVAVPELSPEESLCAVTLLDHRNGQCRFPLGAPAGANTLYCGDGVVSGQVYCLRHCRIAYKVGA
jgi:GcrA cell cycle regulator